MKNKILSTFVLAAISCSSLTSLANMTYQSDAPADTPVKENGSWNTLMTDSYITAMIKKKYIADDRINSFNIAVKTVEGQVTLSGTVPSEKIEQLAVSIAKEVEGVKHVNAEFAITEDNMLKKVAIDTIITSKIKIAFLDDSDINGLDINVVTKNNVVTLEGKVPSEKAKLKAIAIAKIVKGVDKVNANLVIEKGQASDVTITSAIKLKIFGESDLDSFAIHVSTIDGEVFLTGVVKNRAAKNRAIAIAQETKGVKRVNSDGLKVA